ncbi:SCO1860 family LAETG-anchored protein [Streptomyces harbinensis]
MSPIGTRGGANFPVGVPHVYNSAFRRSAVLLATAALLGAAGPAYATTGGDSTGEESDGRGSARATVLRTSLDVGLLNRTVQLPLELTLNEVNAPETEGTADRTALSASLDGVDGGRPFEVLRADVASATATATDDGTEAEVSLAEARLHVPGLPLLSVVELEAITARAVCATGAAPVAEANLGASLTVLGKEVTLSTGGSTVVDVPGVGSVELDLSATETTSTTAAASALDLRIAVNPLKLNVAEVEGRVTLAEVSCTTPDGSGTGGEEEPEPEPERPEEPAEEEQPAPSGPSTQTGEQTEVDQGTGPDLAATGGDSSTPYLAGSAIALLGGGGILLVARRRALAAAAARRTTEG